MRDRSSDYTRIVNRVRLTRATREQAIAYQRRGYTLREIAKKLGLETKPVTQALYWDVVA